VARVRHTEIFNPVTVCRQAVTGRFFRLEANPRTRGYIEEALNGKTKKQEGTP
jgi:hypothetical protein